ncbi:hypothetical protein MLD38_012614 [Melastoma candidum]|uniref:Uncharacterized protein n=1 Tax=Melastoma candidum TaxID=119954 RepID=A0ACB9R868_9MYRT|nr:hypothetical protein MLD38_012614 [Melastoma candidum]
MMHLPFGKSSYACPQNTIVGWLRSSTSSATVRDAGELISSGESAGQLESFGKAGEVDIFVSTAGTRNWLSFEGDEHGRESRGARTYVELSWLAEYWLLEGLGEACSRVMQRGLDSCGEISVPILKVAVSLSQWEIAEIATNSAGRCYRQLSEAGEFEGCDEAIVEMVRAASVRHSQRSSD